MTNKINAERSARLRQIREVSFRHAKAFADEHGFEEGTYRSHENGNRGFDFSVAKRYAGALGLETPTNWARWIMDGGARPDSGEAEIDGSLTIEPTLSSVVWVNELDVRAAAGRGGSLLEIDMNNEDGFVVGRYAFPAKAFEETFGSGRTQVRICNIIGNSMVPDLQPGQRVMVDIGDRRPSPPGIFFVYDGLAVVCKLVEYIPHSDPARVRISSKNADFTPYERNLDEAYICGRVIGVWQRT